MAEGIQELLAQLTAQTGDSAPEIYAKWAALSMGDDDNLERLVRRKLTANAKTSQIKESLLATLVAGGAVGESVEECLLKSGLTGWS